MYLVEPPPVFFIVINRFKKVGCEKFVFFLIFFCSEEQKKHDFLLNFPQKLNLSGEEFVWEIETKPSIMPVATVFRDSDEDLSTIICSNSMFKRDYY
jgi:hypothetical protein